MNELTVFELAWLVGILEGEGSFGFHGGYARVSLKMTDEDVVKKAGKIFEKILGKKVNVLYEDRTETSDRHRQGCFIIVASGKNARLIMQTVVSHMGYRRRARIWQCLNGFQERKVDLMTILGVPKSSKVKA